MIIILISWISQFIVLFTLGHILVNKLFHLNLNWFHKIIFGYAGITMLSLWVSLFAPVNFYFFAVTFIICLPLFVKFHLKVSLKYLLKNLHLILIVVPILLLSVMVPNHGDSSFYHAQALQWIEKYPVVPGLSNFFTRLGFNSTFFNTQAAFSFYPISDISSRFLNGFIMLSWLTYLSHEILRSSNVYSRRIISFVFAVMTLSVSRGWVSSIAPDVPVGIFMLIFFYEICSATVQNIPIRKNFIFLVMCIAISIKVSALFLLPIWLFLPGVLTIKDFKLDVLPILILTPWVLRNIILSGYIIYPYLSFPIFELDWTIPKHWATIEKNWILSWARMPGKPWETVLQLSAKEWMPQWFFGQNLIHKLIIVGFVFSNLILLQKIAVRLIKKQYKFINKILLVWSALIIFWFFMAPDFRFGYGLILPFFVFFIIVYYPNLVGKFTKFIRFEFPMFVSLLFVFTVYVLQKEAVNPTNNIEFPEVYPKVPFEIRHIGYQQIRVMTDENCWNTPIPAIHHTLFTDSIEMRGLSLKDGFRFTKFR